MNQYGAQYNQQQNYNDMNQKNAMQRPFSAIYTQGVQNNIENVDFQPRSPVNNYQFNQNQGDNLQRHQSANTNKSRQLRPSSNSNKFMQIQTQPSENFQPYYFGSQSVKNINGSPIFEGFEGVPLLRPPSASDIKRNVPKHIKKDKERLWEENIQIKYMWSQVQKENVELKTKNMTLIRENQKLQKLIGDVETYLQQKTGNSGTRENLLIVNLKKQVQDLKLQLNQANTEIQKYKRDYKLNNLKELQIELDFTKQECIRLKTLFDQSIRDYAELLSQKDLTDADKYMQMQFSMVNKIKQENEEQKKNFEDQERTLLDKEAKRIEVVKELQDSNKKLAIKEEKINQMTEKIKEYESELKRLSSINFELEKKSQKIAEEDKKLQQATYKIKMLDNKLSEKEDELKKQQKSSAKAIKDASEKLNSEIKDKKSLQDQINKLNEQIDELKIKMSAQLEERNRINHIYQKETNLSIGEMMNAQNQYQMNKPHEIKEANKRYENKPTHTQKLGVVKTEDVEKIGKELNLRCSLKYRNLDEVIKEFFSKIDPSLTQISIEQTVQNLKTQIFGQSLKQFFTNISSSKHRNPFNIQSDEDAKLVARYLIENNQSDYVLFHTDQKANVQVFKSTLRNLIKELRFFEEDEKKKLHNEVSKIIDQFFQTLKQSLELEPKVKESQCFNIPQFEKVNNILDPPMTRQQTDYFYSKLFEKSQTVESFKIDDIQEIFSIKNQIDLQNANPKATQKTPRNKATKKTDSFFN